MNHHRQRQFLEEMRGTPAPIVIVKPPKLGQRLCDGIARDLFALGADALIAQAKAAEHARNVAATIDAENWSEGKPFPCDRVNPHEP